MLKSLILLYLCYIISVQAARLNVPKVLLPYHSSVAVNFTLDVSDGCYTWRSSRPEVVSLLHGDSSSCSSSVVVMSISKTPTRMTSIVIAEDPVTGEQLRCDVIVDAIKAIVIETTTRELYLEDSPEQFVLRALDDEGNVFSSLSGLSFEWSLLSDTDVEHGSIVDAHNVLRIMPYSEAQYETPPYISILESRGVQGDSILVEGIHTGSAKVSAKVADLAYKSVSETTVRLIVIANIMLNPSLVYLMQHASVQYRVELLKQGKTHEIQMPSQQYFLELADPSICDLDSDTSLVTAKEFGFTEIVLKDRNIRVKEAFRQPSAGIYAVVPGYLGFVVLPGKKWVLETGKDYEIIIEIYDKDSHKIHPSDNLRVTGDFDDEYFSIYTTTINGTHHYVKALKSGNTVINGHLRAVVALDGTVIELSPGVRSNQDVEIYNPIQVLPPVLVFPWDPTTRNSYNYQLQATGGSGNYTWSSSDSGVCTVNIRGTIGTRTLGTATIQAADMRNNAHTGDMKVHVVPPTAIEFIPSRVEVQIGETLDLPLAIYGHLPQTSRRVMFADCRSLSLRVQLSDGSVVKHIAGTFDIMDGSCTTLRVEGVKRGHTEITVYYEQQNVKLSTSVTVAAFLPLEAIDPEDLVVVTVGSLKEVIFQGGPQPWVLNPREYYQRVSAEKEEVLRSTHLRGFGAQKNLHMFRVLCLELGDQQVSVTVGNGVTSQNKFPASAVASVRFICAQPVGIYLSPRIDHPQQFSPCPIFNEHSSTEAIPVYSYQDLNLDVTVTDSNGRRFDNFSSLAFDWEVSNPAVAKMQQQGKLSTELSVADNSRKIMTYTQLLNMLGKLGQLSVTARVKRYQSAYFTKERIQFPELIDPPLSAILDLISVADAAISPDHVSIFNHPSNKVDLQVSGGSGYFHIEHSGSKMAEVIYEEKSKITHISPLLDGSFTITAHDLCLLPTTSAPVSNIHISGVSGIIVKVVDKVELTKSIIAEVRVSDHQGQLVKASYFSLMDLKPQPASDIITIKPDTAPSTDLFMTRYVIQGVSLGRVMLHFTAKPTTTSNIKSQPKEIQVFPPLRLEPRNITLIIGAMFQITAYGGPQPQSTIEFTIGDIDIASISHNGLIDSLDLGETIVTGRAIGYEADSGNVIVYSQDSVVVHVVQLGGIRIHAPLKRLQSGSRMPLYAVGVNEYEIPFMFSSASPSLTFHWTIDNKEAVELRNVFHESGMRVSPSNQFSVQLFAHRAGQVNVKLEVSPSSNSPYIFREGLLLVDELQIKVFEKLRILPSICDNPTTCTILITPNTDSSVRTNRDGAARIQYSLLHHDHVAPVVSISESGIVHSGSRTGHTTIVITAHEDFGVNQTTIVHVKVKLVSYLMLNSGTIFHTAPDSTISSVPVGAVIQFAVSYHDDIGAQFTTTNTVLKYRPSRFDLLHVHSGAENSTLVARTINVGETVLKVWSEDNVQMADYININVGYEIYPADLKVTLGDVICYTTPIVTSTGHAGLWTSSSPVLQLDSHSASGVAVGVASQIGSTAVNYNASMVTSTQVHVRAITDVHINGDDIAFLTNVLSAPKSSYIIPVTLGKAKTNIIDSACSEYLSERNLVVSFVPFRCELSLTQHNPGVTVADLFQTHAEFNSQTGTYQCRIERSRRHDLLQAHSLLAGDIRLKVVVVAREGQPEIPSNSLTWPYMSAFYLYTSELQLSNLLPIGSIRVQGTEEILKDITLSISDTSILELLPSERESQSPHTVHYPVRLVVTDALWDMSALDSNIEIRNAQTGQQQTIAVMIKLVGPKPGTQGSTTTQSSYVSDSGWSGLWLVVSANYQSWIYMVLCIIATICALVIAYHTVLGSRFQAGTQPNVFLQPGQQSPTQDNSYGSSWGFPYNHSSPSSPRVQLWTSGTADVSLLKKSPRSSPYH